VLGTVINASHRFGDPNTVVVGDKKLSAKHITVAPLEVGRGACIPGKTTPAERLNEMFFLCRNFRRPCSRFWGGWLHSVEFAGYSGRPWAVLKPHLVLPRRSLSPRVDDDIRHNLQPRDGEERRRLQFNVTIESVTAQAGDYSVLLSNGETT